MERSKAVFAVAVLVAAVSLLIPAFAASQQSNTKTSSSTGQHVSHKLVQLPSKLDGIKKMKRFGHHVWLVRHHRAERIRARRHRHWLAVVAARQAAQAAAVQTQPASSVAESGTAPTPQLAQIAACESGGNPRAIGGGGAFRGKYQFTYQSWAAVGGHGDPAAAPEGEQDRRAAMLMAQSGSGNWPVCG
jgi:hypothetical protein